MSNEIKPVSDNEIVNCRKIISSNIRDARLSKNWTQTDLAVAIGVKRTHITRIESGNYNFTVDILVSIMKVLGISNIRINELKVIDIYDVPDVSLSEKSVADINGFNNLVKVVKRKG